ncbi:uncharacterized protein PV07_01003 [Cladophialophora immunda]|uniref:ERCC4 domain-containing protein n=1 Tax=Cladophialophora immunda TaxID=569365 RepID=A0A0D2B9C2_9EURO|nr:uncharacterized protein PV07_01003 [Cladophialophora immunda]KIW34212.1 hypothetical protein PV07_01003 [Cladophialophora immunda]
MTEVIVLLSSSPPKSPRATRAAPVAFGAKTWLDDEIDFEIDKFDVTGSIDFEIDRPYKRRRSPVVGLPSKSTRANIAPERRSPVPFEILSSDGLQEEPRLNVGAPAFSRSSERRKAEFFDEITFSSSAPEPLTTEKRKNVGLSWTLPSDGSEDHLIDDPLSLSQRMKMGYDHRTTNLLATLNPESAEEKCIGSKPSKAKSTQNLASVRVAPKIFDDIEFSSSPMNVKSTKPPRSPQAEKAGRTNERAPEKTAGIAERQALKEAEKEKKKLEREQKAKEKQKAADLAEVNKSRTNKKDATPEMILDMSSFLKHTSVGNQVEERMKNVQVDVNYVDEQVNLVDDDGEQVQHGSIITWRRKVKSTYNDEDDLWEPTSRCRIVNENHVLIHLPAADFVAIAAVSRSGLVSSVVREEQELKANLDAHVSSIRRRFGNCVPIYLIEGLRGWLRKSENAKNRAYTAAVRAQMLEADGANSANTDPPSQARGRKRKKPATESLDLSGVTSDIVDDLLLHLQLAHQPILIHHTSTPGDSVSQICALTQHLSTRPYRLAQLEYNLKSASFCMDSGQVRTGDDPKDTFVKMLQEVQRVTPSMAYGIVEEYKSIRKLVKGFDKHGNLLLEHVRKTVNKDGGWSDKRLGPQISKRLYKVFMGRDPTSTDGMS